MLTCAEYRRSLLAEPQGATPDLVAHAAGCAECSDFTGRLEAFEDRLGRALRVGIAGLRSDAGAASADILPFRAAAARARAPSGARRRLAIAASVMLGVLVAGALWVRPGASLAADVVSHMAGEPNAWALTAVAVPPPRLNPVLDNAQVRLKPDAGIVSYASACLFRGHIVPHLVVQTGAGPVTVMILTQETLQRRVHFDADGYRGILVPVPRHGSIAVLERGTDGTADDGAESVDGIAARVLGAIEWTGPLQARLPQ